jgi:hypothetical protein
MPWKDVCRRGNPAGGRVREDDVKTGDDPAGHDAGGPSPGIVRFLDEIVFNVPGWNDPPRPGDFPTNPRVETYPGHGAADVHFEGRAADIYLSYISPAERVWGNWLFDYCVQNCSAYKIQGVIYGDRQWFSEVRGGQEFPRPVADHYDHVHVELNCDGAADN